MATCVIRNLWISNVTKIPKQFEQRVWHPIVWGGVPALKSDSVLFWLQHKHFLGGIVNPCNPSILGHAEMIHMWMENFGAVGNFLWKKDCALGTDSVPTKANYSAIFVKFPAQTADLTLLWEDFSNLKVGFVSSSRRIPKICLLALFPALMGFFKFVCGFARSGAILQRVEKKSWGVLHNLVASSFTAADIIIFLSLPSDFD